MTMTMMTVTLLTKSMMSCDKSHLHLYSDSVTHTCIQWHTPALLADLLIDVLSLISSNLVSSTPTTFHSGFLSCFIRILWKWRGGEGGIEGGGEAGIRREDNKQACVCWETLREAVKTCIRINELDLVTFPPAYTQIAFHARCLSHILYIYTHMHAYMPSQTSSPPSHSHLRI